MSSNTTKVKAKKLGDKVITYLHLAETCLRFADEEPEVAHARLCKLRDMIDMEVDVVGAMPKEEMARQVSTDVFHTPDGGYTIAVVRQRIDAPDRPEMWQLEGGVFVADLFLAYLRVAIKNEIDILRKTLYIFDILPIELTAGSGMNLTAAGRRQKASPPVHLETAIPFEQMKHIFTALYNRQCYVHSHTSRGQWNNVCYGGGGGRVPDKIVWIGRGGELRYMISRYFGNTPKVWERTAQLFLLQGKEGEPPHPVNPKTLKNYRISERRARALDEIFALGREQR